MSEDKLDQHHEVEDIEIPILFQDDDLIVVEKPSGVLVHPYKSRSRQKRNLMTLVRDQIGQYVYPIHRLDRPVSGVVVFGLNGKVVKEIKNVWHNSETKKEYISLCIGYPPDEGRFDFTLQNEKKLKQEALTEYWPIYRFDNYTLLKVQIKTGRKHQIRRHFSRVRHNIVGDTTHGNGKVNHFFREEYGLERIFLHAYRLSFIHPYQNETLSFVSPLSQDLSRVIDKMGLSFEHQREVII